MSKYLLVDIHHFPCPDLNRDTRPLLVSVPCLERAVAVPSHYTKILTVFQER